MTDASTTQPAEAPLIADNPDMDATDGAHPAWWRGQDYGCKGAVAAVNRILDSLEREGKHAGVFAGEELETLKHRLTAIWHRDPGQQVS